MSRIAIVGPGAIGSLVAACLHENPAHELILCARRPLGGLHVRTLAGPVTFTPQVLTDPAQATPVDWVLVATKAYDAPGAALCSTGWRRSERRWRSCRTASSIGSVSPEVCPMRDSCP